MRYGNPSIKSKIKALHSMGCENLVILPLYPQYAAATTATAIAPTTTTSTTTTSTTSPSTSGSTY